MFLSFAVKDKPSRGGALHDSITVDACEILLKADSSNFKEKLDINAVRTNIHVLKLIECIIRYYRSTFMLRLSDEQEGYSIYCRSCTQKRTTCVLRK